MKRSCWCGKVRPCPVHPDAQHGHWSSWRDRGKQAAFRAKLVDRAGNRCEWRDTEGNRCGTTHGLAAHHDQPGSWDPDAGRLLCERHHRLANRQQRTLEAKG
jgi:hypothetical protein